MSPLWSDKALAQAAWANAVARGLVDDEDMADGAEKESAAFERVRRVPRPRLHSWAL